MSTNVDSVSASTITTTATKCHSHILTIQGYSQTKLFADGSSLKSKTFEAGDYTWCILFYPNGSSAAADHICLALGLADSCDRTVSVHARFTIVPHHGRPAPATTYCSSFRSNFRHMGDNHRDPPSPLIKRAELEGSEYLVDDGFAVRCVLDSRHGRVLFWTYKDHRYEEFDGVDDKDRSLIVWDPITGVECWVPFPVSPYTDRFFDGNWGAVVLCAGDGCDHVVDCHGNPFLVAVVGRDYDWRISACVYSSEAGTWSDFTSFRHPHTMVFDRERHSVVLGGNTMCIPCDTGSGIMHYDVAAQELSWTNAPSEFADSHDNFSLVTTQDGNLGFVSYGNAGGHVRMYMWTRVEINKEHQVLMVNKTTSFKKKGKGKKGNFKKNGKQVAAQMKKPKSGPKPETECFYCNGTGHLKRNCPK
uniref:CCHC-type domain-containing protein n=1 Tax=Aegilops tauschii TaxID=37682 RepID=M8BI52_AEGTA